MFIFCKKINTFSISEVIQNPLIKYYPKYLLFIYVFSFRIIMKYIINLIEKDKQTESLVEKLCHR